MLSGFRMTRPAVLWLAVGIAAAAEAMTPAIADNQITPNGKLDPGKDVPQGGPYTADPTARVFDGTLYVYTSTDAPGECSGRGTGASNFCMPGYRVFKTKDLKNWSGGDKFILHQNDVPWGNKNYTMWAPDVIKGPENKYYLFFPFNFRVGVAVSDRPDGKFVARAGSIPNVIGFDPSVIKFDGQYYIFTATGGDVYVHKIDSDFKKAEPARKVAGLKPNYKEGPHLYEHDGKLYMLYARTGEGGYRLELARSSHPFRPFTEAGIAVPRFVHEFMTSFNASPTNHGSIVNFKGKPWIFYHKHLHAPIPMGDPIRYNYRTVLYDRICYDNDGKAIPAVHGHNASKTGRCSP